MKNHHSKAILLTGAAARISQEVAIIDKLKNLKGINIDPSDTLLAGFSSGSLNMIAINGLLNKPEWDNYYKSEVLFKLKTEDVYLRDGKLPFNTDPLRTLVNSFLEKLDFSTLKELPYTTYILACQLRWLFPKTRWAKSDNINYGNLKLANLMMATTAIPIIFPKQNVHVQEGTRSSFPHGNRVYYVDGGTGKTFNGFSQNLGKYVQKNGTFDEMYVISPMREAETVEFDDEIKSTFNSAELQFHKSLQDFLGSNLQRTFIKFLKKLEAWNYHGQPMAKKIYVCIPDMVKNFPILSFDKQEAQYNAVMDWVEKNPELLARPLKQYLNNQ